VRKVVLVTGGFDPIHRGHISYIKAAKELGDLLVVGLNSDEWLKAKKKNFFMALYDRWVVVEEFASVDVVIEFDDSDGTAKDAIRTCLELFPDWTIVFANGGDRTEGNIPEMDIDSDRVEFVFGVGGTDKKNSSSWILEEYIKKVKDNEQRNRD
jgi:D-beta-D-heptose 7-phosphate kinase/D-beta-D-heptose 1-phosphate adenosyltransferase